ncbi:hypothetical protein ACB092_12G017400 [Castanea dentata]
MAEKYTYMKETFRKRLAFVTGMICQLKKLQSWVEGLFIRQHSVMVPVVELLAFIMWDLMDGKSSLVMMLESFFTTTIQLCRAQWNRKWLK